MAGDLRVIRPAAREPDPEIVITLEALLVKARAGEVDQLLVVYEDAAGYDYEAIVNDPLPIAGLLLMRVIPYLDNYDDEG